MASKVNQRVRILKLRPSAREFHTIEGYLSKIHKVLRNFVERNRNGKTAKIQLKLRLDMMKYTPENNLIKSNPTFASNMLPVQTSKETTIVLKKMYQSLASNVENFLQMGSGWTLNQIIFLECQLVKCKKYVGGSRVPTTILPLEIRNKRGILNMSDIPKDWCFHYAIAACLLNLPWQSHPERASHYQKKVGELEPVHVPMDVDNIPKFETKNKLCVDVLEWNNNKRRVTLLYKSQQKSGTPCKILLYQNHYYTVRNINALFQCKEKGIRYICEHCYAYFSTKQGRQRHEKSCKNQGKTIYIMPTRGEKIKFSMLRAMVKIPFVIYADFEAILTEQKGCKKGEKTELTHSHMVCAFAAYRVCTERKFCAEKPTMYLGPNALTKFFDYLQEERKAIFECIEKNQYPIDMTSRSEMLFAAADRCEICRMKFLNPEEKYRDHDHLKKQDNYRAALCNTCNLTYAKLPAKPIIKVLFLNSCRYDMHFLIQELSKRKTNIDQIRIIPKNTERFLMLKFFGFQVLDTYEFLPAPLASLVKNLKEQGLDKFIHLKSIIKNCAKHIDMLCSKQFYPYEYAQSLDDYDLPGLPAREEFVDKLSGKGPISEAEYAHVKEVFSAMECKTFGDYTKLYVQTDVLLLADVMEAHRSRTWKEFGLDPLHFLTASHLGWNAFLKTKNPHVPLENLTDKEMYDFFQNAVRGGIAVVSKRYSKANHPLMKSEYDPKKTHNFILALDCVGLYSWTMCQPLPHSHFEWVNGLSQNEMKDMLTSTPTNGAVGYFACVDLQYPAHIHDESDATL